MARLFLTNIDLNTNELQNAVIQNLSSAPLSGNKEGRIYYDVTAKALYLYTNGSWKPLASGGAAASSIELTGDVTGTANVDPATGKITLDTTVVNNSVALGDDTTGDYVQQVHGTANQISVDYESGEGVTATISLPSYIDIPNGEMHLRKTEYWKDGSQYGIIVANQYSGNFTITSYDRTLELEAQGDIYLNPSSGIIDASGKELHIQKTEYWRDGGLQGIIAAQSDGSLRLTGTNSGLQLETNSGDISLSPSTGVIESVGNELHITKVELHDNSNNNAGVILAHPSDGSLTLASTQQLNLESHNGDITLSADSGNVVINNNLVTDTILSKSGTSDTLTIVADSVEIQSPDVKVGGGGTNGAFQVLDSNSSNAFIVNGSDKSAQFGGNVTIDGDLNVNGTLNAVNRTEINIEDNTIRLNTGFTGSPTADAGIIVERGTANDTAIIWSETNDQWTLTNDGSHYYAIARKYVEVVGDASNTSFDVVHNLGTRDITVMVRENNAEYNVVETDILMKDGNTVTIGFTDAPALNAYKVIIVG